MFHFELRHVPGSFHGPDGLSRRPKQPDDADEREHGERHHHEHDEREDEPFIGHQLRCALAHPEVVRVPVDPADQESQQQEEDPRECGDDPHGIGREREPPCGAARKGQQPARDVAEQHRDRTRLCGIRCRPPRCGGLVLRRHARTGVRGHGPSIGTARCASGARARQPALAYTWRPLPLRTEDLGP